MPATALVSGAGIAGPALAYWLKRFGFQPSIVERSEEARGGGQAIDVRGVALDVVRAMGLLDAVRELRTHMKGMSVLDTDGNEIFRTQERTQSGGRLDSGDIELFRDDLCKLLLAKTGDVEYLYGESIARLAKNGIVLEDRVTQPTLVRLAALVLAAVLMPAAVQAATSIPFTTVDGGLIAIRASLDGGPQVPMLVDLGAGIDVLATTAAKQLNLRSTGRYTNWRMSGERVDVPTATIASIRIGSLTVEAPVVSTWSGLDGSGFAGLIAATAFRNAPVTFDFQRHVLVIEDAALLAARVRSAVRVPLVVQDDRGISLELFARFDFGSEQSGLCEIDTGSQGYFLDRRFAQPLGIDLSDPARKRVRSSSIASIVAPIPLLRLQGAPQTAVTAPHALFADLIYDCNVGNDFWANRAVTFDIPNRALYFAAADAQTPAPGPPPVTLPNFFIGSWTCNGVFPASGKKISSTMTFASDLGGTAIVKHHDDTSPPALYHAVEVWTYGAADKRFNAAVVDNFGGVRDFASPGWDGDRFVWTSAPYVQPPQRFAYERRNAGSFTVDWQVAHGGSYVTGDTLTCTRT